MKKVMKVMTLVVAGVLMVGALTACGGKKEEEDIKVDTEVSQTSEPEVTDNEDNVEEEEKPYDTYKSTILGVSFDFDKSLAIEDATADQMKLISRLTEAGVIEEGKVFDIQRMQVDENTLIAQLEGKDEANTTVTVVLAPFATVDDVLGTDVETPIEEQEIRQTAIDEAFVNKMKESLTTTMPKEGKYLVGEVLTTSSTEEAETPYLTMEYSYANAEGTEKADYTVVHTIIPCGKNIINIVAMSQNKESKVDKITISEVVANSMVVGRDLANGGASEVEVIDDNAGVVEAPVTDETAVVEPAAE